MPQTFFGNPELIHNNDISPKISESKMSTLTQDSPEAILKLLKDSGSFENLMKKYSQEDRETWERCIIAAAKLVLYFEFCNREDYLVNEKIKVKTTTRNEQYELRKLASKRKNTFATKMLPTTRNSIEKITKLAEENNLTLDSTISVNRAAIAYFEDQKNITPRSQPYIGVLKIFYPRPSAKIS